MSSEPVLYALLGTCAYLLRCFEEELRAMTFMLPSRVNLARFLIADIGGAVFGLFGNFTITQRSFYISAAIAFLAGYAVDIFLSFLHGLVQTFTKRKSGAGSRALQLNRHNAGGFLKELNERGLPIEGRDYRNDCA